MPKKRDVGVAISPTLISNLHEPKNRNESDDVPSPAKQEEGCFSAQSKGRDGYHHKKESGQGNSKWRNRVNDAGERVLLNRIRVHRREVVRPERLP